MSVSYVLYKDVAPMAEEDASTTATGGEAFSQPGELPHGLNPGKTIALEKNQWLLDGEHTTAEGKSYGLWSSELSGADCTFTNPPVVDIQFTEQHSSLGITLEFDPDDLNFCSEINIKWYQGDELLADVDFSPDSTTYFCSQKVESYNHIVITLNQTSLPYRRAKLNHIIFGVYRRFGMDSLRKASIIEETSLISTEIPTSTLDIDVDSTDDIGFMFQLKQPMECWTDELMIGVFYIDEHTRSASNLYSIGCYDAWGVLDESLFSGGYYSGVSAKSILTDIVSSDFDLNFDGVTDVSLSGIIKSGTRREAAQQVLFAAGWVTSTSGSYQIRVFTVSDALTIIGEDRSYYGVSATTSSIVTEVQVTTHSYTESTDGSEEVNGTKYADTTTVISVKNPDVTANDKQNIIEVKDATLVSPDIGQEVAQRVYDYYLLRQRDSAKIVWKGEGLGDLVQLPTPWGTAHSGYIEKMTITLSNTVAANVETIGEVV